MNCKSIKIKKFDIGIKHFVLFSMKRETGTVISIKKIFQKSFLNNNYDDLIFHQKDDIQCLICCSI